MCVCCKSGCGTTIMMKPFKTLIRQLRRRGALKSGALRLKSARDARSAVSIDWLKVGLMVFTIAALSVLMSVNLMPDKISLRLGDVSPIEVRAARSVRILNTQETERQRALAREKTPAVYDTDEAAAPNAHRIVQEFFIRIERERAALPDLRKPAIMQRAVEELQAQFGSLYTPAQMRRLLSVSPALLQKLRATTTRLVDDAMEREVRDQTSDLKHALQDVANGARITLSSEDTALVSAVAQQALRPNRLLNRRKTDQQREAAARTVVPVSELIQRGDRIIGVGERVTPEHLEKFTALGLLNPHLEPTTGLAICVLAAAMVFLVVFHIARALPALYADRKRLALLTVIVLISVFGIKMGATLLGLSFSNGQLGYLGMMSVAAAGMLVSVLLDRNLAVMVVALLSVQSGLIMNHEIRFTIMTLMSSLVGIISVGNARSKINLLSVAAALASANLALVWLLGLLLRDSMPELLSGSAWAGGSALFATFLFWFGVLVLEKPFGILTHTTLLELSSFDRPLLQHLCAVAPGTYAHSIMVGTLAEAGAQAIGADALLSRVGGYYHDIGKTKRPEFFVENQRRENVHSRLSPSLSALIITAHVRDGVEMAKEHRLPDEIRDIITQHHGTTLISYFYHQALADNGSDEVPPGLEERFRYPGPKPQTREAALVMLADSVEAAARCQEKPTPERLASLIASIVRGKIEDRQLDECDLTFRDLKRISDAFLHVLIAMMHGRINYPTEMPRTASGLAMEVSRADLRPEHVVPLTETTVAEPKFFGIATSGATGELEPETAREVAAHLGLTEPLEAISALELERVPQPLPQALTHPVSESELRTPLKEPEILYDRLSSERLSAPDADSETAAGSPPPAPRRGLGTRRS